MNNIMSESNLKAIGCDNITATVAAQKQYIDRTIIEMIEGMKQINRFKNCKIEKETAHVENLVSGYNIALQDVIDNIESL